MPADTSARARAERAVQERAQALVVGGKLADAVKLLDGYLAQSDGDWGLWLYFAGLCARSGKRDEAVAAYRASARQLEGDGFFARARAALVCAVKLTPRDANLVRELERVGRLALLPREKLKPRVAVPGPSAELTMLLPPPPPPPSPARNQVDPFAMLAPRGTPSVVVSSLRSDPFAALSPVAARPDPFALVSPPVENPMARAYKVTRLGRPARASSPAPRPPDPARHVTSVLPGRKRTRRPAPTMEFQTDPHCAIFDILDAERAGHPG